MSEASSKIFDASHYASNLRHRLQRGLELGPKYYFLDVPRYLWQRRKLQLSPLDWQALWNPVRSFRNQTYRTLPLPPRYEEALERLFRAGVRIGNPRSRTEALVGLWWEARNTPGDVIECGAYRGATSLLLAVLAQLHDVPQRVLMLDTFEGMPAPSDLDSHRESGELAPPAGWVDILRQQVAALEVEDRTEIHQGLFAATFAKPEVQKLRFSFAHIDANIYVGTKDACEFTLPRLSPGGAVVFDDYNGLCDLGARLAIDAYVAAHPGTPTPQPLAECSAYFRV